jgi:putative copper resistance protein D
VTEACLICRFLHFSAAMLLLGTSAFAGIMLPPRLRLDLDRALRRMTVGLLAVALLTSVAWFAIDAAEMGNGWSDAINPDNLVAVVTGTEFGSVWVWHLAIMAALVLAYAFSGPRRWLLLTALSTLFLASLGFVGHAAMFEGTLGTLQRLNHALHLISAGLWVGVLPPLVICLMRLRDPDLSSDVAIALQRFSGIGHFAVAIVILTGAVNTYLIVGGVPLDLASPYQLLLDIKIGLVLLMVMIALLNRYHFVPTIAGSKDRGLRNLVWGTVAEIVLSAGVVGLVSAFATFDPS